MGRPQEDQVLHSLSPPSAGPAGRGGEEIWASGSMGPSMSSPSPLSGRGSEKAGLTCQHQIGLDLCLCVVMQGFSVCPLSNCGHIRIMIDCAPSRGTCRCLSQLEVCQLLQSETHVAYPEGLNGCLIPVVTVVPGSLAHSTNALNDEPTLLQVDLSQFTGKEHESKATIPSRTSTSTSPAHLPMAHYPKAESQFSMTTKVSKLLLWAVLDTSSQASGSSTP